MMRKQYKLVITVAACAFLAVPSAQAGITFKAGDWDLDISGFVNAYYTHVNCESPGPSTTVASGLACVGSSDSSNVRTGLLPSWFGFSAKTKAKNIDVGFTLSFQPGVDSGSFVGGLDQALGLNTSNFRQVFLTVGGERWGKLMFGRNLGIYASDAILSDMTLLGVGSGAGGAGGNTTLGRIGVGYLYADWKGQISYWSPKWQGFSFAVGLIDPFGLSTLGAGALSHNAVSFGQANDSPGFEGKASYEWSGAYSGKVWGSFLYQSIGSTTAFSDTKAKGFDVGGKFKIRGFEVVGYYYTGEAIGTTAPLFDAVSLVTGTKRDSDGGYAQATYVIPGPDTKIGVSWGQSRLDLASGEPASELLEKMESFVGGIYHPLNKYVNIVFEYTRTKARAHNGNNAKDDTVAIGAILAF
jgi:predicted porin